MRLCFLANASSVHTSRWVKYFIEKGHEVHVISFESAIIPGAQVHVLKLPLLMKNATFPLKVASIYRIRTLVNRIKPDVLHTHYVTNYGFFGALCGFKPLVMTAWGSDVLMVPEARLISAVKKFIATFSLKKADVITCDAQHMKEAMKKLGIPTSKIELIFFGVDTRKFTPEAKNEKLLAKLGVKDSPTVMSLRNLEPIYDIETLIKSAPLVLKEAPDTQFIIAGRGSEERKLRALTKSLGIESNIKFIGFIPNNELPQYLNSIDVYVSTALSDAGIAASTAEAMSCGLAVVITDVADNKKWVTYSTNGFLVPPKDQEALAHKITYLLRNEEIRRKFGLINRRIIEERNNYYREMGKMETIYKKLAERYKK